jgi:hypothetical protein
MKEIKMRRRKFFASLLGIPAAVGAIQRKATEPILNYTGGSGISFSSGGLVPPGVPYLVGEPHGNEVHYHIYGANVADTRRIARAAYEHSRKR